MAFKFFKKKEEVETPVEECIDKVNVQVAYEALINILADKRATKAELIAAIEEAVVHLEGIVFENKSEEN